MHRWEDTDPRELARTYRRDVRKGGAYGRPESFLWWLFGMVAFYAPIVAAVLWVTR